MPEKIVVLTQEQLEVAHELAIFEASGGMGRDQMIAVELANIFGKALTEVLEVNNA